MQLESTPSWQLALNGLRPPELAKIDRYLKPCVFKAKSLLFEDGVSDPRIFVVTAGRVRTFYVDVNGKEFTTRVSGIGSLMGIVACMTATPPEMSVQALDHVSVLSLGKRELDALLDEIPLFAVNLSRLLAAMYREQLTRRKRTSHAAPVRLAKALCFLSNLQHASSGWRAGEVRGLTQQDLANIVGTSRTWVSVMLGDFERSGILERSPGCIKILDYPAIELLISRMEDTG